MQELATKLIQTFPDLPHLLAFAQRLLPWLLHDLNASSGEAAFGDSRAKALLRAADLLDDPTRHSFMRLMEGETAVRLALHNLLSETGLADNEEIKALAATTAASAAGVAPTAMADNLPISQSPWLALAIAAYAWKSEYPVEQLDPASPPDPYSPAGQVLKRAAYFLRQQVQRSATERDKFGRQLAHNPAAGAAPALQAMPAASQTIAPVPPHFRPPIPVRYPEVARETVRIETNEQRDGAAPAQRSAPLTITESDLAPAQPQPTRMPSLKISADQIPAESVRRQPPTPRQPARPARRTSSRGRSKKEPLKTTKLRVVVQEYPDGPGLYGLQVHVNAQSLRSSVSGITNRDGRFLCELPVYAHSGLTYDVDIIWPQQFGGHNERKSITLHADRTEFTIPFYQRLT